MEAVRSVCSLNCPDTCAFLVERTEKGLKVRGDRENNITRGFICSKGQALAERVFSPDRLCFPLLRQGTGFKRIEWEEAYSLLTEKIRTTCETTGSQGILHHFDFGHNGVLRTLDRRFFQALGGATEPSGSMCWGAGYRAQEMDFGAVYSSLWDDLEDAKTIILWGRDPAVTSIHLMPYLLDAKKRGAKLIVINPVRVKSTQIADEYIQVQPGSDGALALGLGHIILAERWMDLDFIRNHVKGFEQYARRALEFTPERVAGLTGVDPEEQRKLARLIAMGRPVSIFCGYGMQRYVGGGNTVRAIDALAAITGNVGSPGAGAHYGHQYHKGRTNTLALPKERYQTRLFPHATLAISLLQAQPEIKMAVVTRSNPLVQQADSHLWWKLWQQIPFKVTMDTVLTETGRRSDLILPVTTIFEEEDLLMTSWSPLIQYGQKVIEPQGEARPEPEIFTELALRLGLEGDFPYTPSQWIEYVLKPLEREGVTLERLREGPIQAPYFPRAAWVDRMFATPSGKIELFSERAERELGDGVADYIPAGIQQDQKEYPWFLITSHSSQGMNSQFQDESITAYIHPDTAERCYLLPGDIAQVETVAGQLPVRVAVSEDIHRGVVMIPEGTTTEGYGVNCLISVGLSDCGENTPYYDMRCTLRKLMID